MLNIAYNTTRLDTIIQDFLSQQEYIQKRKAQNRGRAATPAEVQEAITDYLKGDPVSTIAKYLYRSPNFVKNILDRVGVPQRPPSAEERTKPCFLPENCVAEEFESGEKVWSAYYHAPAIVDKEINRPDKYESKAYSIYVLEKSEDPESYFAKAGISGFYAYALACELGKLKHLEEYGVNLKEL